MDLEAFKKYKEQELRDGEIDLVKRMLEEGQGMGVLSDIWYDPYRKVMVAEYIRWERTEEKKEYPAEL